MRCSIRLSLIYLLLFRCFHLHVLYLLEVSNHLCLSLRYLQINLCTSSFSLIFPDAEALEITFDPETLSYKELVDIFFRLHDPTQLNRQGPYIGSQYRSVIFYHTPEQKKVAEELKIKFQNSEKYKGRKIVTEIIPALKFYRAEEYHQRYFEKNGFHACVNFLPLPIKKR